MIRRIAFFHRHKAHFVSSRSAHSDRVNKQQVYDSILYIREIMSRLIDKATVLARPQTRSPTRKRRSAESRDVKTTQRISIGPILIWRPSGIELSPQTADLRTNKYVLLHSVQDGGYIAQVEHSNRLISLCSLLVPPDTHVADPGSNHPLVDVGLSARLETTFGLEMNKWVRRLF